MNQDPPPRGSKNCYPLSGTVTLESNHYTKNLHRLTKQQGSARNRIVTKAYQENHRRWGWRSPSHASGLPAFHQTATLCCQGVWRDGNVSCFLNRQGCRLHCSRAAKSHSFPVYLADTSKAATLPSSGALKTGWE